jgi:tetratricopeptide (TPR) repeat protein
MVSMPTLRLTQTAGGEDLHQVEIALEGDGLARQVANATFPFRFSDDDQRDLRWYLEEYLQAPEEPNPKIAARVERRMAEIGADLFQAVFRGGALRLWARLQDRLEATRVEIVTGVAEATAIPWELLRDPDMDVALALRAASFVRAQPNPAKRPSLPRAKAGAPLRILLVICRPHGREDVPFRSVSARILKSLTDEAREAFDLDVLRPPTFEALGEALRRARTAGKPYQIVHFDGHGGFFDMEKLLKNVEEEPGRERLVVDSTLQPDRRRFPTFSPAALYPRPRRGGRRGYLLFESPAGETPYRFVDGPELGNLLAETGVPVLVLNACRSAHGETVESAPAVTAGETPAEPDPHRQVRAWGSLAQEVMDAGAAGVVAMRYNVYVDTAAQFVADLYAALAQGQTLGEAVTLGRKQLHASPLRELGGEPLRLEDWPVPVVYEAAPLALFPKPKKGKVKELKITVQAGAGMAAGGSGDALPPEPDAGFFGRDETILALDRAFDQHEVVLLHAYAGSGKTSTAAEFARWYGRTGGVEGPILFTSFERYLPLPQVLDQLGQVFEEDLARGGTQWLALSDQRRREVALQILQQVPVLWIWDNVEPVAGFPSGRDSAWREDEQQALGDFLRAARGTRARFLLTSRREERAWLGDLPRRVAIPPMPLAERRQLAHALAGKAGWKARDTAGWGPLLQFSQGNPLTLTVLVRQAVREGLREGTQVEAFVEALRRGEKAVADSSSQGRSDSLAASLSYGFEHAFGEEERRQLALLHLFQGFVDVDALRWMGNPEAPWCLPEVRGLTREAGMALLDRAAEVGLLAAHGDGYYSIHPALPWFFQELFARSSAEAGLAARRAFVEAVGELGDFYTRSYLEGQREVLSALRAEEANLLQARRLALENGWWRRVISAMEGLRVLYGHTGRRAEWKRLVEEVVPAFVEPETEAPLPGREEEWSLVMQYRVLLAREERNLPEAERLQGLLVEWARRLADPLLAQPQEGLTAAQKNQVRTLAASLHALGQIQREGGRAECVAAYKESLELAERIGDQAGAAVCALNLGHAYRNLPDLRDLSEAERWSRRSLDLRDPGDRLGRGKSTVELGSVALKRFEDARVARRPEEELLVFLNYAARWYHQALELLPEDAVDDLAVVHNQLGYVYDEAGDLDRALPHFQKAIRYLEIQDDLFRASLTRYNVALALGSAGRFADALAYAEEALRGYASYGERAGAEVAKTRRLIEKIQRASQARG